MVKPQLAALCLLLATVACTAHDAISSAIARQFAESKDHAINLATAAPGAWDKVCVLGPYSSNNTAKQTLGFAWNAEALSSIQTNEGISLLLFVQGQHVVTSVEHPRQQGDFSALTTQCFARDKAQFIHNPRSTANGPELIPKNAP